MWATSANGTCAPAPSIHSANVAAIDATRSGVLPDTTSVLTARAPADTGKAPASGPCSITTCAFVPPKPNDDTAARRGPGSEGQGVTRVGTKNRVGDGSMAGFHREKCRFGGIRAALYGQRRLDETGDPCCRLEMTEVGLRRAQRTGMFAAAIRFRERLELDRITQHGCRYRETRYSRPIRPQYLRRAARS